MANAGDALHTFHLWLCRCVCYQVEDSLKHLSDAANVEARLSNADRKSLSALKTFVKLTLTREDSDERELTPMLLNKKEYSTLIRFAQVLELRNGPAFTTPVPEEAWRTTSDDCVREINQALAPACANEFANEIRRLIKQQSRSLPLDEGLAQFQACSEAICYYLEKLDRRDMVPQPRGTHPTATSSNRRRQQKGKLQKVLDQIEDCASSGTPKRSSGVSFAALIDQAIALCKTQPDFERLLELPTLQPAVDSIRKAVQPIAPELSAGTVKRKVLAENRRRRQAGRPPLTGRSQHLTAAWKILQAMEQNKSGE